MRENFDKEGYRKKWTNREKSKKEWKNQGSHDVRERFVAEKGEIRGGSKVKVRRIIR